MTNDELKKKILSIVRGAILEADELPFIETTNNIADALIAAGIGDVKETEHRAEVAERALRNMASNYWGVECRCLGAYDWEECEKCKDKYILAYENEAVDCLVKVHLEQAEKELKEEKKND